jgi:hypothetical protein
MNLGVGRKKEDALGRVTGLERWVQEGAAQSGRAACPTTAARQPRGHSRGRQPRRLGQLLARHQVGRREGRLGGGGRGGAAGRGGVRRRIGRAGRAGERGVPGTTRPEAAQGGRARRGAARTLKRPWTATWNVRRLHDSGPPGADAALDVGVPRTDSSRRPLKIEVSRSTARVLSGKCAAWSALPSIFWGARGRRGAGGWRGLARRCERARRARPHARARLRPPPRRARALAAPPRRPIAAAPARPAGQGSPSRSRGPRGQSPRASAPRGGAARAAQSAGRAPRSGPPATWAPAARPRRRRAGPRRRRRRAWRAAAPRTASPRPGPWLSAAVARALSFTPRRRVMRVLASGFWACAEGGPPRGGRGAGTRGGGSDGCAGRWGPTAGARGLGRAQTND